MASRPAPAIVLSIAVHAAGAGAGLAGWSVAVADRSWARSGLAAPAAEQAAYLSAEVERAAERAHIREARRALIDEARAARAGGTLSLGEFLIRAGALDAREAGGHIDEAEVVRAYRARVASLRRAVSEGGVIDATADVFSDLSYHGKPGGLMAEALLEGGGACEPLSQLVAAALVDAGQAARVRLRFYGGGVVQHLAPIVVDEHGERWDLLAGAPPRPGGAELEPGELVEVYARAHERSTARGDEHRLTLAAGYPANRDIFGAGMPLFAQRAIRGRAAQPEAAVVSAADCAFAFPVGMLDPPRLGVWLAEPPDASPTGIEVELVRVPKPAEMERAALLAERVEIEIGEQAAPADRLMGCACLAALYDKAATDFALLGQPQMVGEAAVRRASAQRRGRALLSSLGDGGAAAPDVLADLGRRYSGRFWLLLELPGGSDVVLELVRESIGKTPRGWGLINTLAALTVFPQTRSEAIGILSSLPLADRVDVMHEIYHAHDHLPPSSASFPLEPDPASAATLEFSIAYTVFRRLAWRLWEGRLETGEVFRSLIADARARDLDSDWEAALVAYYGDNLLGLYQHREGGMVVVAELSKIIKARPHPLLRPLERRLAFLRDQKRLDVATLAEAFRAR